MTQDQLDKLEAKVEKNNDALIRGEHIERRLEAMEAQVSKLCGRITAGMWAMVCSMTIAVGALIAAIWHIVTWIQELINHAMIIT